MKRGRILDIVDCCVHVTQRCHDRHFLMKFAVDRRNYVRRLREAAQRFEVSVLDYAVTCNHVHLLLRAESLSSISEAMQSLQGLAARDYNRLKQRSGAFWSDRFNPTLVQPGPHLSRCLFYIDLNMVRAGAVCHLRQWAAGGFQELARLRRRYRILDVPALLESLDMAGRPAEFRQWYLQTID